MQNEQDRRASDLLNIVRPNGAHAPESSMRLSGGYTARKTLDRVIIHEPSGAVFFSYQYNHKGAEMPLAVRGSTIMSPYGEIGMIAGVSSLERAKSKLEEACGQANGNSRAYRQALAVVENLHKYHNSEHRAGFAQFQSLPTLSAREDDMYNNGGGD